MYTTGSIDLADTVIIPEEGFRDHNLDGRVTIQLFSDDISETKAWTVEMSLDKTNWATAKENAVDLTGNLVKDAATLIPMQVNPHGYWRIKIAAGATGNVSYIIHD